MYGLVNNVLSLYMSNKINKGENMTNEKTIKQYIKEYGLTMSYEYADSNPNMER